MENEQNVILQKPAINKYAFLWPVHIIAAGTGPTISLVAKTHQLVKTMVFQGLLVWLIISGYEIVSLFTFAISFDWYSSKSLLQWWSYELLNLLRQRTLFYFSEFYSFSSIYLFTHLFAKLGAKVFLNYWGGELWILTLAEFTPSYATHLLHSSNFHNKAFCGYLMISSRNMRRSELTGTVQMLRI